MPEDTHFEGALLPEFDTTATADWHAALAKDLGSDWREALEWDAGEGVRVLPFYRAADLDGVPTGTPGAAAGWRIRHDLSGAGDPAGEARTGVEGGVEALGLPPAVTGDAPLGAVLDAALDAADSRADDAESSSIQFHLMSGTGPSQARRLLALLGERGREADGSLAFDPCARRFVQGQSFDAEGAYDALAALLRDEGARAGRFRFVTAHAEPFHDAGAGPVASLALALASMSEHFARLTDAGIDAGRVAATAQWVLPVGTRFFVEVARLRAARRLFAQLAEAYGAGSEQHMQIQACTARRSTTLYDPHLNLVRGATIGAAAAVVGGTDVLAVRPFDAAHRQPSAFGRRLARNAQHILREEAALDATADPAGGSYYTEVLTDRLARRAWENFQEIEDGGGLLEQLRSGSVRERLASARAERQDALAHRRRVRVGTNQFPNLDEVRRDDAPDDGEPVPRETAPFERLRLATERHARQHEENRPAVFLLPVGTPKVRSARARFARDALGCAGLRAIEHVGFETAEEGAQAAAEAVGAGRAHLVACAAPDDDYADLLPAVRRALGGAPVPIVAVARAGTLPDHAEADALLYRGMDLLGTLERLQSQLGIG